MIQGGLKQIFTNSYSSSVNQIAFDLTPGSYEGLLFHFESTNDTGQTFDPSDLGELVITDPRQLVLADFDFLDDLQVYKGGILDRKSTTGSSVNWYIYYRFAWWTDFSSIYEVASNETVRIMIRPVANLATVLGANNLTVTCYGIMKKGEMPYRLKYDKFDIDIVNGTKDFSLPYEDVLSVYIENNTNIDEIKYFMDSDLVFDSKRLAALNLTHVENALETYSATNPVIELNFNRQNDLDFISNDSNVLQVRGTGSATITVHVISIDSTPAELEVTRENLVSTLSNKLRQKAEDGKARPVLRRQVSNS